MGVEFDAGLKDTLTMLESAQNDLQESVYALRHYQQDLDADPQQLREQEQRMAAIVEASRKYRVSPEALPQALQGIVARLEELGGDADIEELAKQDKAAHELYLAAAKKLSAAVVDRHPDPADNGAVRTPIPANRSAHFPAW